MPFVVTQNCIKCKYTDCVEVCPVDCFHEGPNMLVIDPDECIDCTLCEPECPIEAIMCDEDVPEDMSEFIELNAELSKTWPVINEIKTPPEDADEWKEKKNKIESLELIRQTVPSEVTCTYIRQAEPLGLGHAVLCAASAIKGENFAVLLPDDLVKTEGSGCLKQMVEEFSEDTDAIMAVERIPLSESDKYGICLLYTSDAADE